MGSRREEAERREERGRRHPTDTATLRENQRKGNREKAKGERGGRGRRAATTPRSRCCPVTLLMPTASPWPFCFLLLAGAAPQQLLLLFVGFCSPAALLPPRGPPAAPRPLLLPSGLLLLSRGPLLPCPPCPVFGDPSAPPPCAQPARDALLQSTT